MQFRRQLEFCSGVLSPRDCYSGSVYVSVLFPAATKFPSHRNSGVACERREDVEKGRCRKLRSIIPFETPFRYLLTPQSTVCANHFVKLVSTCCCVTRVAEHRMFLCQKVFSLTFKSSYATKIGLVSLQRHCCSPLYSFLSGVLAYCGTAAPFPFVASV